MVPEGYKLVFEDDFNGDSLDPAKWRCRRSGARRCGFNSASQVRVENGNLIIRQKYFDGEFGPGWYSGWVGAVPRFIRGYFEVRCICNKNVRSGSDINPFWSAFWIQARQPYKAEFSRGGPGGAEIDVVEALENMGGIPGIESNIHVKGMKHPVLDDPTDHPPVFRVNIPDCFTEYHTYALVCPFKGIRVIFREAVGNITRMPLNGQTRSTVSSATERCMQRPPGETVFPKWTKK